MTRPTWNEYFMNMAIAASTRGTCPRASVGCVLVYQGRYPVATGYNGADMGENHCLDVGCYIVDEHCQRATHAEINAINIARNILGIKQFFNMTLYCTHAPCLSCAKRIEGSNIHKVFYLNAYVPTDGLDYLSKYIQVERVQL